MPKPDCNASSLAVSTQTALNDIVATCAEQITDGSNPSLLISNYTDTTLAFPQLPSDFADTSSASLTNLTITDSSALRKINFSAWTTNNVEPAMFHHLAITELPNLGTLDLSNINSDVGSGRPVLALNFAFENLPKLENINTPVVGDDSFFIGSAARIEDVGAAGGKVLFGQVGTIGKETPTNMPWLIIRNASIPDFEVVGVNTSGPVTFSNPTTGYPPFNISMPVMVEASRMEYVNLQNLSLPGLTSVDGDFVVKDSALAVFGVDALKVVEGDLRLENISSSGGNVQNPFVVQFKALQDIGGGLVVRSEKLGEFSMAVQRINGSVNIEGAFTS
jgi:hypothetical protein